MSATELSKILKEGELEKRSDNLLQFWRRKTCVLTADSLNIYADSQKKSKSKELKLQAIKKVDCVERSGKFVYFTIVTTEDKEMDFRCSSEDGGDRAHVTRSAGEAVGQSSVSGTYLNPANAIELRMDAAVKLDQTKATIARKMKDSTGHRRASSNNFQLPISERFE
ncbi:hypothetical protein SKAU_G00305390 [Synaphobranchus kaupii]|uniref:Pleckstrin homology-like domain family A member 2 n=1 Tax=Synaphobranchus kaupii TaxID=118154 RepID=A0A9Q1IKV0_SYNKA|nr:hypothetical protein SKAU_G00305390 [Synaphobranchus kaupii]